MVLDRSQRGADVFFGNARVIFESVTAGDFAGFRNGRGDDRPKGRYVYGIITQLLVSKSKVPGSLRQALGGVVENITAEDRDEEFFVEGSGAPA
jgi:hypothetical protein